MEIDPGDDLKLQNKEDFGKVFAVDRVARTIDIRKGPKRAESHPTAVFAFTHVPSDAMEGALIRIGESVVAGDGHYGAAHTLLSVAPPRLRSGSFVKAGGETEVEFAVRVGGELDQTVLAIQGPPGRGENVLWREDDLLAGARGKKGRDRGDGSQGHPQSSRRRGG
jgi:uncharacterized protein